MPKIRKVKRRKSFKVNVNRKRLRDKLRKLPAIECKDIKDAWENGKSTRTNMSDMGLAYDVNEALKIPNFKGELLQEARQKDPQQDLDESRTKNHGKKLVPSKFHIAANLEAEAKAPRERRFRLPDQQVTFLTRLMDKYGEDYKSMARDPKNYYQLTWRQIKAKIDTFKNVPEQYAEYLLKTGDIVLDDPESLAETRRKLASSNVEKYCAVKPKKVKIVPVSQWTEEILDFDCNEPDRVEEVSSTEKKDNSKKLKLFPEDDEESKPGEAIKRKKNLNPKIDERTRTKVYSDESSSSEGENQEDDDDNEEGISFVDLNNMSDEQLSDDDIIDEFVSDDES